MDVVSAVEPARPAKQRSHHHEELMSIHHFAIATKDFDRAHRFYTEAMGFQLIAGVKRQAIGGSGTGWTKHMFYDCGNGSTLAIWDLHLNGLQDGDWKTGYSTGLGLPWYIVHVAFGLETLEELEKKRQSLLNHGVAVSLVEHEFITSIYMNDPDGNMVEFTVQTRPLTDTDRDQAMLILADDTPAQLPEYSGMVSYPDGRIVFTGPEAEEFRRRFEAGELAF
ncbi:hypothetical protein MSAS_17490 [Mycobacterium saskatchewanense]|uniref:VOC family protein n=1 Tax=Mycobacterium saskatchewanense TaxID=220927 RepID=UPI00138BD9FA|nr:VOC family protein [Mycobacterium saskatchewanense]BBX62575.1 hypothetical protein MSAS_17490 [Mycobacterium saskatchewanense]